MQRGTVVALAVCAGMFGIGGAAADEADATKETPKAKIATGLASWYGPGFHGRRTASGETFDSNDLTAAHRTLPFGTRIRVVNESNGREVVVRINDRGPFAHGRVIDLSRAAARTIGVSGVAKVTLASL